MTRRWRVLEGGQLLTLCKLWGHWPSQRRVGSVHRRRHTSPSCCLQVLHPKGDLSAQTSLLVRDGFEEQPKSPELEWEQMKRHRDTTSGLLLSLSLVSRMCVCMYTHISDTQEIKKKWVTSTLRELWWFFLHHLRPTGPHAGCTSYCGPAQWQGLWSDLDLHLLAQLCTRTLQKINPEMCPVQGKKKKSA